MRVSTKDRATTNTQWIHTTMTNRTKCSQNNTHWSYVMRDNIATDQYKVDLCDSKSTNVMTILESIKYSINLHRNLEM